MEHTQSHTIMERHQNGMDVWVGKGTLVFHFFTNQIFLLPHHKYFNQSTAFNFNKV